MVHLLYSHGDCTGDLRFEDLQILVHVGIYHGNHHTTSEKPIGEHHVLSKLKPLPSKSYEIPYGLLNALLRTTQC